MFSIDTIWGGFHLQLIELEVEPTDMEDQLYSQL
jgi:hypothetical protein